MKDNFLTGYTIGSIACVIVMIITFSIIPKTLRSSKKIVPKIQITIDNEKIDTTYIYKKL